VKVDKNTTVKAVTTQGVRASFQKHAIGMSSSNISHKWPWKHTNWPTTTATAKALSLSILSNAAHVTNAADSAMTRIV
jgi:hypothetical protein